MTPPLETTSTFRCPCCRQPLRHYSRTEAGPLHTATHPDTWEVHGLYCPSGRCESEACNQGKEGATEQAAFTALEKAYDNEDDIRPDDL